MKKSVSNVVAGGLITGATVMSADAVLNTASASLMEVNQTQEFNFDFNTASLTCCFGNQEQDFVFDGFDRSLGVLNTVTLGVSLQGLTNDPASQAMTCCYDLTDVTDYGGQIAGQDLTEATVRSLGGNGVTISLDATQFGKDLNTATLDFNILFADNKVFASGETRGSVSLNYIYEPSPVPLPGSAALLAPALAALFGMTRRRRREEEDE